MPQDEPQWLTHDEQVAWRAYLRASRALEVSLDRDLQSHGVGLSEYELLSMLSESSGGRLRMSTLADLVIQSRSRVTHTASRLEKRGWVTRQPCLDDRRGVELVLTASGRQEIAEMAHVHVDSVRRHMVDVMTPAQFVALGQAMTLVRAAQDVPSVAEPADLAPGS